MAEITVFDLCSLYIEYDEEVVIWNVQKKKEVSILTDKIHVLRRN